MRARFVRRICQRPWGLNSRRRLRRGWVRVGACRSLRNTCRGGRSRNAGAEWFGDRGTSRGRLCGANRSVTIRENTYGRTNRKRRRPAFTRDIWLEMSTRGNRRAQQASAPTNAKIEPEANRLTSKEVSYVDAESRRSSASFVPNREGTFTFRMPRQTYIW